MIFEKISDATKEICCDEHMCKNKAMFVLMVVKPFKKVKLQLCLDCIKKIYRVISRDIIPKSPRNIIKKNLLRREDEN